MNASSITWLEPGEAEQLCALVGMMGQPPNAPTAGPAYDASKGRYYYEIWWLPMNATTWSMASSSWLDPTSGTPAMAWGAGQLTSASCNCETMTRVWDQDSKTWTPWTQAGSADQNASASPFQTQTVPASSPASSSSSSSSGAGLAIAGLGGAALLAWLLL